MSYNKLSEDDQRQFARNLVARRLAYTLLKSGTIAGEKEILIVGDRPGPGSKNLPQNHHNTPFYAKTYCSGWLNALLVQAKVFEDKLLWINSASYEGVPADSSVIKAHSWKKVIALGGNASKWLEKSGIVHDKYDHPQYHKRFKSKEAYPLIEALVINTRNEAERTFNNDCADKEDFS